MKTTDPRYKKKRNLKRDELAALVRHQGDRCAICRSTHFNYNVDHCHFSGNIRGILCTKCNTGIGQFDDDPNRLWEAIKYLDSDFIRSRLYDSLRDATPWPQSGMAVIDGLAPYL